MRDKLYVVSLEINEKQGDTRSNWETIEQTARIESLENALVAAIDFLNRSPLNGRCIFIDDGTNVPVLFAAACNGAWSLGSWKGGSDNGSTRGLGFCLQVGRK